jgi:hypothetical protein
MRRRLDFFASALLLPMLFCAHGSALGGDSTTDPASTPQTPAVQRHKHAHATPTATLPEPAHASAAPDSTATPSAPASRGESGSGGFGLLGVIVISIALLWWRDRGQKQKRRERVDRMVGEAEHWLEQAKANGKVSAPNTGSMIIPKGEHALLAESTSLYELRVDSTRHYLGTRVKIGKVPFYVGSSKNISKKVLKATSSGTLALADKGLLFVGSSRTARVKVGDIVGVEPTIDSIVVNSGARAAPLVFSVQTPFTWFLAIKLVASGDLKVTA